MAIEWNKVTWYSKLLAVILFVATFAVAFCLGMKWQEKSSALVVNIPTYTVPHDITLGIGESAKVGDLTVTFNALLNDYRCPIDVTCIQAGAVNTNVTFATPTKTETKNMPSDEVPQEFEGYKISIIGTAPPARSQVEIEQKDYVVTFHVSR